MTRLTEFTGRWTGTGSGRYPTIDDFLYREELTVTPTGESGIVHYVQRTWRIIETGEVPSHIETGFVHVDDQDRITVLNAQGADRVEVLTGTIERAAGETVVRLRSSSLAHDDRMVGSWRTITIGENRLDYEMGMTTIAVPGGADHLRASLVRTGPDDGGDSGADHDEIGP